MRRTSLWIVLLLTGCAGNGRAAGINLGWDDCPGGGTYALAETFACNTNVGFHTLVGSFVAPAGIVNMTGNEIVIDLKTSAAAFPAWWSLATGLCRAGSLSSSFDFTGGPFSCYDYWQGGALGGIAMLPPSGTLARIKAVCALPAGDPRITSVPEGLHLYSFKANINSAKTVGAGSCGGCTAEMCIVLNEIAFTQAEPQQRTPITNPAVSNYVVWQSYTGWAGCPGATPARQQTWGSIKALYR